MAEQLHRLALAFATAFLTVAVVSGYWGVIQRDALVERGDNARRLLLERRVARGTIYDRHGEVLAESVGSPGELERHYPYPDLAPVLGYISPLYGAAGVEAELDSVLHGDAGHDFWEQYWQDAVLGAPPTGRDVRLSIDLELQRVADEALGDRAGAAILLHSETGEILAMASHPTYDANQLDTLWPDLVDDERAPLLNRAALALYQPGGALWPVVLAGALQTGYGDPSLPFPLATEPVAVDGQAFGCRVEPPSNDITLTQAFHFGCPWPVATLGGRLGTDSLLSLFEDFRLYRAFTLRVPSAAASQDAGIADPKLAAIGQGELTITPLHLALITAALAERGEMPPPHLVLASQTPEGEWLAQAPLEQAVATIAPEYADQVKAILAGGYAATAITGAEGQRLAWYTSFTPLGDAQFVATVLLEDGDMQSASEIGRKLLAAAGTP